METLFQNIHRIDIQVMGWILVASMIGTFVPAAGAQQPQIVRIEKQRPGGEAPAVAAPMPDVLRQFDLSFDTARMLDYQMGMGLSWGDYNNDGKPDLFIAGYYRHPDILYRNRGDGTFIRAETEAGVEAGGAAGFGCAFGDYDNDGLLDLYVVNVNSQLDFLWKNNGNGTFTDVSQQIGMNDNNINNFGCAWGDYNGDGWLDLFLVGGNHNRLYRNLADGTLINIAPRAGLGETNPSGFGCAWGDYDADGDLDLFVTASKNDYLYRNNGNGTFANVATEAGIVESASGMGCSWVDYDNDGRLDLYVAHFGGATDALWRNNGNGTFTNVADKVGINDHQDNRGVAIGDYDNDGDWDIFSATDQAKTSVLWRNNGNGTFTDVASAIGMPEGGWAIGGAWCDYDDDGDIDLYVTHQVTHQDFLYTNRGTPNNWIKVNAVCAGKSREGDTGTVPKRLAIGAWIEVDLDGGSDFAKGRGRYIAGVLGQGDGLDNQAVPFHAGVGKAKMVDVRVKYPTGKIVKVIGIPVNRTITVSDK